MSDNKKRIYGLIGWPVKHSLSPAMHNAAFKALGMDDCEYRLFEVEPKELDSFLSSSSLDKENIYGLNVTVPHKVKAREILERKFPFDKNIKKMEKEKYYVKLSGAINTIKRNDNKLDYWNTDAAGFLKSLEEKFDTVNKKVLLIGCGGTGRAVIASLGWQQVHINKIYINDINRGVVDSIKKDFSEISDYFRRFQKDKLQYISREKIPEIMKDCDLLINATPVGMKEGDSSPTDKELLRICKGKLSVYDVVYNRETQLIKDAKELGIPAVGGLGMLLYQGMLSFEIWTGENAPEDVMRKALLKELNKSSHL